jgi:serine-type D-Ala-D-Ala carboxypeptidase
VKPEKTMETVRNLMEQAVREKIFPGGVLLVSKADSIIFMEAYGVADIYTGEKTETHTIYDLASLTKPLATTPAIMYLVKTGQLRLDTPIGEILQGYKETDKKSILIQNLLCHNAGLADYLPLYKDIKGSSFEDRKIELRRLLRETPLKYPLGEKVLYSDLGFMILNHVIEVISGKRLDHLVSENIYGPMGLDQEHGLFFIDLETHPAEKVQFAATEYCPWRRKLIKGEVHDENAYWVGGIEGHAGLFGKISAVHTLLKGLMDMYHGILEDPLFSQDMMRLFLSEYGRTGRTLGFDMPAKTLSSAGKFFSKNTVGHLGFSGTSFWMDLDRTVIVILLTNRIHPVRENARIREFRPVLHDRIMDVTLS